jgi:hypothetical protein
MHKSLTIEIGGLKLLIESLIRKDYQTTHYEFVFYNIPLMPYLIQSSSAACPTSAV